MKNLLIGNVPNIYVELQYATAATLKLVSMLHVLVYLPTHSLCIRVSRPCRIRCVRFRPVLAQRRSAANCCSSSCSGAAASQRRHPGKWLHRRPLRQTVSSVQQSGGLEHELMSVSYLGRGNAIKWSHPGYCVWGGRKF